MLCGKVSSLAWTPLPIVTSSERDWDDFMNNRDYEKRGKDDSDELHLGAAWPNRQDTQAARSNQRYGKIASSISLSRTKIPLEHLKD